jgi:hypothetical protein
MNGRNAKRRKLNRNEEPKIITRCGFAQRIVWDSECCVNFIVKDETLNQNICKNCKHSF